MSVGGHPAARTYVAIYGWLLGLTALEVTVVLLGWPKAAIITMLLGTALGKALLIGLYFMHLKFDAPAMWLLPAIPVALAAFFIAMLFPDLVFHLTMRM